VIDAVAEACGSAVARSRPVAGGSINEAMHLVLADGRELFVKHRADPPAGFYASEAAGLRWLASTAALALPEPVAVTESFLAVRWVDEGPRGAGFDAALGRGLAALHAAGAERHGATADGGPTFLGPLRLDNGAVRTPGWAAFHAERRLLPLLRMAVDGGAVPARAVQLVERVIGRLDELGGPDEPPARLHGDLWRGNVMAGREGAPVLVDPAAHGGHRESDLAMLRLFGAPSPAFLQAYEDAGPPLADGHEQRVRLHQLQPLLVHAVLFGGGYGGRVQDAAARYA
jgi:fructosamine-3-kinase